MNRSELRLLTEVGSVSALCNHPDSAKIFLVLAHGAGAGMRHPFLEAVAEALAERQIATLRYQFPYVERGGGPDPPGVCAQIVRAAVAQAHTIAPNAAIFAGGKSFGGRMTSEAAANAALLVRGLCFFGFPLHRAGVPDERRAAHLDALQLPLLFLQGTRDALADLTLITSLCRRLQPRATLRVIEGADHSFHVLKRSGRSDGEVIDELADQFASWASHLLSS